MTNGKWTVEEEDRLAAMWAEDKSTAAIAEALGTRSLKSVRTHARVMGLKPRDQSMSARLRWQDHKKRTRENWVQRPLSPAAQRRQQFFATLPTYSENGIVIYKCPTVCAAPVTGGVDPGADIPHFAMGSAFAELSRVAIERQREKKASALAKTERRA